MTADSLFLPARRRLLGHALAIAGSAALPVHARTSAHSPSSAHVAVIGAGMAGLYAALKLQDAGFRVSVLEAQARIGGRNWTLRAGDRVSETVSETLSNSAGIDHEQVCAYSPSQYLNAGPWRILAKHTRLLAVVKRFDLALEPVHPGAWQPAGGMDALPRAMAAQLDSPVMTSCVIQSIERIQAIQHTAPAHTVRLTLLHQGQPAQLHADYALIALPLHRLAQIALPLPDALRRELGALPTADALKIGMEWDARSASSPVSPALHASYDAPLRILPPCGDQQRIVTVYANDQGIANTLPGPRAQQLRAAEQLVAQHTDGTLSAALAIQWSRIPFIGAAATHSPSATTYKQWRAGMPPLFFASDALSPLNGWQEGALESAAHAVARLSLHWQHSHA